METTRKPVIGREVSMVAYNGRSVRKSRTEGWAEGPIVKITKKYIHIRDWRTNAIWITPVHLY